MANTIQILFNTTGGSDTQASGCGPATAVFGTSASYSGSVFTLDGSPDLSGVTTSHLIWVATSTGRQFFTITAVDDGADTVTVGQAPAGTASGLTWGIGGKRNDLNATSNRTLFGTNGMLEGWDIVLESDQSISSALALPSISNSNTVNRILSSAVGTLRKITQSANDTIFETSGLGNFVFEDLHFVSTNAGTSTRGFETASGSAIQATFVRCLFGDPADVDKLRHGVKRNGAAPNFYFYDCGFIHCGSDAVSTIFQDATFVRCAFIDNGGHGIAFLGSGTPRKFEVMDCIFADNTSDGINFSSTSVVNLVVTGCTFHNNGGDGLDVSNLAVGGSDAAIIVCNNNFTLNTGYGIRGATEANLTKTISDGNNFGTGATANVAGDRLTWDAGPNDLAVDPGYADATNYDFSVGTNVKALGIPLTDIGATASGTRSYIDIGAAQRQEPAGGGAAAYLRGANTLLRM